MDAEIVVRDDVAASIFDEGGSSNGLSVAPLVLLDELYHGVKTGESTAEAEHAELYLGLARELDSGELAIDNPIIVSQIRAKAAKYAQPEGLAPITGDETSK